MLCPDHCSSLLTGLPVFALDLENLFFTHMLSSLLRLKSDHITDLFHSLLWSAYLVLESKIKVITICTPTLLSDLISCTAPLLTHLQPHWAFTVPPAPQAKVLSTC